MSDKPRAARLRPSDRLIGRPAPTRRRLFGWWPIVAMYGCGLLSGWFYLRLWACP